MEKTNKKSNVRLALGVWGRVILAMFMCVILFMSLSILVNGLLSTEIGYYIVTVDEDGNSTKGEEIYYAPGEAPVTEEDLKLAEGQQIQRITELGEGIKNVTDTIILFFMLSLLAVFPYNILWELGSKDENLVRYKHEKEDLWRGLKIGLLATIPSAVLYLGLVASKFSLLPDAYLAIYRILNIPFLPYIGWVLGTDVFTAGAMNFWQFIGVFATLLFIPAVSCLGYRLGYAQFSIKEHITYTNSDKKKTTNRNRSDSEI